MPTKKTSKTKSDSNLLLYMIVSKNDSEKDVFIENTVSSAFGNSYTVEYLNLAEHTIEYVDNVLRMKSLVHENKVVYINYSLKDLSKKYVIKKPRKKTITYEEKLIQIFSEIDKKIVVFLNPDNSDKRKALQKFVTTNFKFVEIKEPSDDYIIKFIKSYAKKNKKVLETNVVDYIFDNVAKDTRLIQSELDKLFIASGNITLEFAKDVVVKTSDVVVFDIIDAIAKKNIRKTFNLVDDYMGSNDNIFALVVLLQRSFRMLYYAVVYGQSFATKVKMNPYVAKKYVDRVKLFSERELVMKMMFLLDCEVELKRGSNPQNSIYDIVLELVS